MGGEWRRVEVIVVGARNKHEGRFKGSGGGALSLSKYPCFVCSLQQQHRRQWKSREHSNETFQPVRSNHQWLADDESSIGVCENSCRAEIRETTTKSGQLPMAVDRQAERDWYNSPTTNPLQQPLGIHRDRPEAHPFHSVEPWTSPTSPFAPSHLRILHHDRLETLGLPLLDIDGLDIAVELLLGAFLVVAFSADADTQAKRHALDAGFPDLLVQLRVQADVVGALEAGISVDAGNGAEGDVFSV